jgi:hypothetical protein
MIGARFRRDVVDPLKGKIGEVDCTVVDVEPVRPNPFFCRKVVLQGSDGRMFKPFFSDLYSTNYRALDNILAWRQRRAEPPIREIDLGV